MLKIWTEISHALFMVFTVVIEEAKFDFFF